ncbi:MAG: two-component regulator propeller domain-containing protein, partial [Anaerolineae bacterium]
SLSDDYVETLIIDRAHQLWVGTRRGLDLFLPARAQFAHYQSDPTDTTSLSGNTVVSVFEDRGGMLWIGTFDGGLNLHDRSQDSFAYYHHVNGQESSLSSDLVFPMLQAPNGKMWIGTYDAGLNLFDPATGRAEHFRHDPMNPDSLLDDTVTALFQDADHTLWIGTHQGMDHWAPASTMFRHYVNHPDDPTSIPFGTVYRILRDSRGTLWVGTAHGLRIFNAANSTFSKLEASGADTRAVAEKSVPAIIEDRSGKVWVGTGSRGLFRFDPETGRLEQYNNRPGEGDSLSIDSVLDIMQDSRGTIWVSTFGGGLNEYLPGSNSFRRFRQAQGLPNDVVYGAVEARDGKLWLSTNQGLSRFDAVRGTFENYSVEDGLQSNEFNSDSFASDEQGRLYFGGVRGLTTFDPADIQPNSYVPPLAVTSLTQQDGKAVGPQRPEAMDTAVLSYPQNSFDVSFAALSYSHSDANQYKYMLEGFDRDWHNVGADHRGSYTNLPGGTYTLRMIGSNSDGVWNEAGATLKITVIPPFWQTWLFRIPAGIVLVLAAFLAYRSRVRGIQEQKTELEHIVVDRTQALQKQNLDLEALYSADELMLRVLSQDQVLQVLVDLAVDVLQADKSAVFTKTGDGGAYVVRVSRGFRAGTAESSEFAQSQQEILASAEAGEPIVIQDTLNDPSWTRRYEGIDRIAAAENIRSLMYIPIRVGEAAPAVLNVCSSMPGAFDEDRQRLFSSLVQRAALSIENARLFAQTRHMAILEERNRVAQELHDSAKQRAFAALAQLGAAKKLVDHQDKNAREHLVEAENIVSEVIHDLTFFIQESYSGGLKEKGLAPSLQEYAFTWQNRFNIPLNLAISGERRLPLRVEQAVYRVVQEGLANVARHSHATRASVELAYQPSELRIRIEDNGTGFDAAKAGDGMGLPLIQERLEGIGGRLTIESRAGGGTELAACVPLREEVEEEHG